MVPWRDAKLHVLPCLHYASSVFEGERVYSGQIFESPIPSACKTAPMDFEISSVDEIETAHGDDRAGRRRSIRPVAWRGDDGLGPDAPSIWPSPLTGCPISTPRP